MQNQQQMAAMAGMNANMRGPVDGTPTMGNLPRPGADPKGDPRNLMNTYIYDYFLRNNHYRLAKVMVESNMPMNTTGGTKPSPDSRNVNGVDAMDSDEKDSLPRPQLPATQRVENSFLMDWWCQFWDIYSASRNQGTAVGKNYSQHTRSLAQMQNENRNNRMMMAGNMNAAQYQNMMRAMPNGVQPNDLKRAAAMNRNPGANPMANANMMNKQMMGAQMQRDGSQMELNGQQGQSPGSAENAPSPNKRPRVDGGMNAGNMAGNQFNEFPQQGQNVQQKSIEVYAQSLAQQQRIALNNHAMAQGMNPGVPQGSPMNHQVLDGQQDLFAGNGPRPGMAAGAPGAPQGNHALQDYQMQLMLLEQQNKKRLLMARQEQDSMSAGPHTQAAVGQPGFAPAMSPQGSRAGPSPNPTDQMKRGTPKLGQQGLPGSPMPDAAMQQRGSPAPGMNFDPSQMPPGMPPQFPGYNGMPQTPMMRPPSSHPGFNGQPMTPQQMEAMRQNPAAMQNGAWRGPGGPQGMMQQGQQMGGPMQNPQQRNQMPPPPAPPAGEQPRTQEPSPQQPAQAPPTPSQGNKAAPKKKGTKDNAKKPANKKGATTGATPAASNDETAPTPTPSTPITPMHKNSFNPTGQQPAQPVQQPPQQQPPPMNDAPPFGSNLEDSSFDLGLDGFTADTTLENFDFDSFLHVGDNDGGFSLGNDFTFGDGVEAGADL